MKIVNIKLVDKQPLSLVCAIAVIISFFFASIVPALAASPSLCAITFGTNPEVITTCAAAKNLPDNVRQLLSAAEGKCFAITVKSFDPNHPSAVPADCNQAKFQGITKIARSNDEFNKCQNADDSSADCVKTYISVGQRVLSAGVGIIVVIMLIIGGIQYSAAGGDPQKVAAAKTRIFNAILALLAYLFLFAFLNWIIPGG